MGNDTVNLSQVYSTFSDVIYSTAVPLYVAAGSLVNILSLTAIHKSSINGTVKPFFTTLLLLHTLSLTLFLTVGSVKTKPDIWGLWDSFYQFWPTAASATCTFYGYLYNVITIGSVYVTIAVTLTLTWMTFGQFQLEHRRKLVTVVTATVVVMVSAVPGAFTHSCFKQEARAAQWAQALDYVSYYTVPLLLDVAAIVSLLRYTTSPGSAGTRPPSHRRVEPTLPLSLNVCCIVTSVPLSCIVLYADWFMRGVPRDPDIIQSKGLLVTLMLRDVAMLIYFLKDVLTPVLFFCYSAKFRNALVTLCSCKVSYNEPPESRELQALNPPPQEPSDRDQEVAL